MSVRKTSDGVLEELLSALSAKRIVAVELTHAYTDTIPNIKLPPNFGQSIPFKLHNISKYEKTGENGPLWYWNWFLGWVSTPGHTSTRRITGSADEILSPSMKSPSKSCSFLPS